MPSVGDYLREGRNALGVSLEEISARTRISVRQLDALETNRLERLPGGVFNISFARQYARELNLDEDQAAGLIKEAMGVSTKPVPMDRIPPSQASLSPDGPASKLAEWASDFFRKHGGSTASILLGAALIGGGLYYYDSDRSAAEASPAPVVEEAVQEAIAPPVEEARVPTAPIELNLEVIETVWVRAVADGERLFEETLSQGESRPIVAHRQVDLKVGNAAGVLLSLNGQELPAIGPRGTVRTLVVTPQGVESQDPVVRGSRELSPPVSREATIAMRWAEVAWSAPIR